jgi:hypothetical protein
MRDIQFLRFEKPTGKNHIAGYKFLFFCSNAQNNSLQTGWSLVPRQVVDLCQVLKRQKNVF